MKGGKILIIDDDPFQHEILGDYLELAGYETIHAENGEAGLQMLESNKPDLVLLDVQMPGIDGFQTLKEIRKKAANRNMAVLLLTALDRLHLKIKGLELGADDFVTKPFDNSELLARINAVLRRSVCHRSLEGVMEGDISEVGMPDLLQSMELGSKTATITLEILEGQVLVQNGELLRAQMGKFTGDDALLRIILNEKGYFSIRFNELPENAEGSPRKITSVLMNILNSVDEIKHVVRRINAENRLVRIVGNVSEYPEIEEIKHLSPATFTEMIVAMSGDPLKNIKTLIAAFKKKLVKIEK